MDNEQEQVFEMAAGRMCVWPHPDSEQGCSRPVMNADPVNTPGVLGGLYCSRHMACRVVLEYQEDAASGLAARLFGKRHNLSDAS